MGVRRAKGMDPPNPQDIMAMVKTMTMSMTMTMTTGPATAWPRLQYLRWRMDGPDPTPKLYCTVPRDGPKSDTLYLFSCLARAASSCIVHLDLGSPSTRTRTRTFRPLQFQSHPCTRANALPFSLAWRPFDLQRSSSPHLLFGLLAALLLS